MHKLTMIKTIGFGALLILGFPMLTSADVVLSGFGSIADTDALPGGAVTLSDSTTVDETITDVRVVLQGAVHSWVGDLQITLSNGTSEIIIMGLQDGLTFNGTNTQQGTVGAGGFGSNANLSGVTALDYVFGTGGADFDAAAEATAGNSAIDSSITYAPTAENASLADIGTVLSFADVFAGQSTAGTWSINVVDTFTFDETGSFAGFEVTLITAAVPEPGSSLALIGLGGLFFAFRRRV